MATHFTGPLLGSNKSLGGAGENLLIEATNGANELITVFDDFNSVIPGATFGTASGAGTVNVWEDCGWTFSDVGAPGNDLVTMNSAVAATLPFDSSIRIDAGDQADTGGNMQLDFVNLLNSGIIDVTDATNVDATRQARHNFQHIWIAESGAGAAILDNTVLVFACRIGLVSNAATWDGKLFVGWAEAGDVGIFTVGTGAIAQAETGPLVGFHINGDSGSTEGLFGISQRTVSTAYAEGTNRVTLYDGSALDSGTANVGVWFDLAVKMHITDMSDNAANGRTTFYSRRVPRVTTPGIISRGDSESGWTQFNTIIRNQTPNNDVALVPTIELVNGPTNQSDVLLDWWAFGMSRANR